MLEQSEGEDRSTLPRQEMEDLPPVVPEDLQKDVFREGSPQPRLLGSRDIRREQLPAPVKEEEEEAPFLLSVDLTEGDGPVMSKSEAYRSFRHFYLVRKEWFRLENNRDQLANLLPSFVVIHCSQNIFQEGSEMHHAMEPLLKEHFLLLPVDFGGIISPPTAYNLRLALRPKGARTRRYSYRGRTIRTSVCALRLVALCLNGVWVKTRMYKLRNLDAPASNAEAENIRCTSGKMQTAINNYLNQLCDITGGL